MLTTVHQLDYAIVLCEDLDRMKAFYRDLFDFPIASESATGLTFQAGAVKLSLRQRTRGYDGRGTRGELPGVQLAFLVAPEEDRRVLFTEPGDDPTTALFVFRILP